MVESISGWKSDRAARRFESLYRDATSTTLRELQGAGLPAAEVRDLPGPFGLTRCLHWPGPGEPLVLLHGQGASWVSWAPLLQRLVGRDVYALDTIGEAGGSTQASPVGGVGDLVAWLGQTLDQLGLARMALVG